VGGGGGGKLSGGMLGLDSNHFASHGKKM
jgi:hypothetical protein